MNRVLFLVRHAQTHIGQHYTSDKARELKHEGITQATLLGKYLADSNYRMDLIISSDAERAKSTTVLISTALQYPLHQILFAEKIYSGTLNDLLAIIKDIPDTIHHVMMVGHFPAILELNNLLSDSVKAGMSTCELIVLEFTVQWSDITSGSGKRILNYDPTVQNE